MEQKTKKVLKILISILIGVVVSIMAFFVFIITLFSLHGSLFFLLLCVFYISVLVFLVLWNKINSKKVYLVLSIPALCIVAWMAVLQHQNYIDKIPTVEQDVYLYKYNPLKDDNLLAKLDEKSHYKMYNKFPRLVLDGATALYPVYASFVQAAYEKAYYNFLHSTLLCNGTDEAYVNLFEGKADIIFCAAPSQKQLNRFNDNNINIKFVPIGREAFVFFVNKKNPVSNVSIHDIQGIYSGRIKNWKAVGGSYQNIKAFQRPENSGSQTMLEKIMAGIPLMSPGMENVEADMGGIISQVAVYRNFSNAIGYSFLYFCTEMVKNDHIKLLSIDGIFPSKETIQNGSYPFSDNFYAIYVDDDEKNEHIEPFIEWVLSAQGQELVQKTGYVPR